MTQGSGIKATASGERHIPQSVRSDGSVRREIKIRPGYQPPEDVEIYKNRTAESFKQKGKTAVPGADPMTEEPKEQRPSNKNAKRREAKRKAKGEAEDRQEAKEEPVVPDIDVKEIDKDKQVRNLRKKLRQARELQNKKAAGADLMPEQFAKVIKMSELIRQLQILGVDDDGS